MTKSDSEMSVWEGDEDSFNDLWESPHHRERSLYDKMTELDDQSTQNPVVHSLPHSVVVHGWVPFMVSSALLRHKMFIISAVLFSRWCR